VQAVCCPDGRTCCPHGHRCNVKKLRCDPTVNTTIVDVVTRSQPIITEADVGLVCPDHSQCPTAGAACCRQYSGRYGCCAYPQASTMNQNIQMKKTRSLAIASAARVTIKSVRTIDHRSVTSNHTR